MQIKYSLIVATYNRKEELKLLLNSLNNQTFHKSLFEVIIVDQNESGFLDSILEAFKPSLNIHHIYSTRKGLSYCRNLGIQQAKGTYITVPDDDCTYYEDTLKTIDEELEKLSNPDMVIGRVFNREQQKHVFKKTPQEAFVLNKINFYKVVTSITLVFNKNAHLFFDERFGIGEKYNSNEDGELILNFISHQKKVLYSPHIEFNHPPYNADNMGVDKLYKYGIGFGALCRKYLSVPIFFLFCKVITYQFAMLLKACLTLNKTEFSRRWHALNGRISGFFIYRP